MKKSAKKVPDQIAFYDLVKSLRIPLAQKPGKAFENKKGYNRKDKRWKKEIE